MTLVAVLKDTKLTYEGHKVNILVDESHHTAMGSHLPHGITQCYLPPDTSERALP